MDLNSILELLGTTFIDRGSVTAVFETATGSGLRADLSISGNHFRAVFQGAAGTAVVTPGNVLALTPAGALEQAPANTQQALDAWKSQPPLTPAPILSGLQQLSTGVPAIDAVLRQLAGSGGQLAVGIIPTLCWTDARYRVVQLPGVRLTDVVGRVCFRDILINDIELSLGVDLEVACARAEVTLGDADALDLRETALRLGATARYAFPTGEVAGELEFLSLRARRGAGQVQGIGARDFAASAEVRRLRLEQSQFTAGTARLTLAPADPAHPVAVDLPGSLQIPTLTLGNVRDGGFRSLSARIRVLDAGRRTGEVVLRGGRVRLDVVGVDLGGGGPLPQLQPPVGTTFDVEVRRFRQVVSPDGATDRRLGLCLANLATLNPSLRLPFGSYALRVDRIDRVKLNAWDVGDFDARVGFALENAAGALEGPNLPGGGIQISNATLRLFSDEYGPCATLPQVARRHTYAQFDLQLAGFPKRFVDVPFQSGEIPISPAALLHFLGGRIHSDVLRFILDFIARGFAIAGMVDVEAFLIFHGQFTIDFDPTQSHDTVLVFQVSLTLQMDVVVRVFGQIGICPICVRVQIGGDHRADNLPLLAPSLTIEIEWEFDPAMNRVRIRRAEARNPDDLVALLAGTIVNTYLQRAVVGQSISLPPEFQVRGIRADFGTAADDAVRIVLAVSAEKLDWA